MKITLRYSIRFILSTYLIFCIVIAVRFSINIYHLTLLAFLMILETRLSLSAITSLARKLPVKWWQIFLYDEKRDWSFSYTRTVCSILLLICFVIIGRAIYIWDFPGGMIGLVGSMFTMIAALLGIKRGSEAWITKPPYSGSKMDGA